MSWREEVLKTLKAVLETPPDSEARLEACVEHLDTVADRIGVAKVEGARELASRLRESLKEAA